ncbi:uncharacterized protein G2W53_003715 [Senna tora]|uniref:Uncharacterized protein n=1 Tax=Senna tora TaxID=362788 RepID=A0A834XBK7_9FABA|nr:uncharacterized protein G2W53_003715 [Senna tora]
MPLLYNPFHPDMIDRQCDPDEVNLTNARNSVEELWSPVVNETQAEIFGDEQTRACPANLEWVRLEHPFVKVNVDAAAMNIGGGALGSLVRDANGHCLGAYVNSINE